MLINITYQAIIFVVYRKENVNYMSNRNALTFMKVEEGFVVDKTWIMNYCVVSWIDGPRCRKRCKWMKTRGHKKKLVIRH
jgi:hypothetical protein